MLLQPKIFLEKGWHWQSVIVFNDPGRITEQAGFPVR